MPHYRLTREELAALTAYIRTLGTLSDPGIHEDSLRIGVILPEGDRDGEQMHRVVTGEIERVNRAGGLFRRRLVVVSLRAASNSGPEAWREAIRAADLFALVAVPARGGERALAVLVESLQLP